MSDLDALHRNLTQVDARLTKLAESEADLVDSLRHIGIDMDNTLAEFIATTNRDPEEYHPWRHRAKWAKYHKEKALTKVREEQKNTMVHRTRLQMLIIATESGYRGEDSLGLLKATYLLLMNVLEQTGYQVDQSELGLITTVQLHCGYGVPGEIASQRAP